jgi:hypothetical protein
MKAAIAAILVSTVVFATFGISMRLNKGQRQVDVDKSVDHIFDNLVRGELTESRSLFVASGWKVTLPSGRRVLRDVLQKEAEAIIRLGPDSVPSVCRWVRHDNLAIRYVATFSLKKITGIESPIGHFETGNKEVRARLEEAIKRWEEWWEKNSP